MGNYADTALILWDGISRGSKHMYTIMNDYKKPTWLFTGLPQKTVAPEDLFRMDI